MAGQGRKPKYVNKLDYERYRGWQNSRNLARIRCEEFYLTEEEFFEIWTQVRWFQRGKHSQGLVMTRIDPQRPWQRDNVKICSRQEQLKEKALRYHRSRACV